ncbi:hypothetical protein [Vulcaniibacterium gelatinicum]|uniref:hypothetical protein n=1 Tax=Vulcaniibacterium gelatinicum TaxID=2598725 RepID=UPI0015F2C57F|nr:hypothetical protein [Vulcaniibacterium gelatinicum]
MKNILISNFLLVALAFVLDSTLGGSAHAGQMVSLGALPGGTNSFAADVSADGTVVVGSSDSEGEMVGTAFRWTVAEGMRSLGTLPGDDYSFADAVSADGRVVVGSSGAIAD